MNDEKDYNNDKVLVRFKFKDENNERQEWMTLSNYHNLKQINIIKYCEIMPKDEKKNHDE